MPEVCVAGCGYGSFTIRLLVFRTSKQSDTSSYQDRNQNTIKKKKTIIFPSGTESDTRSLKEGSRFWTNNVKGIQNWSRPTSCQEMSLFLDIIVVLIPGVLTTRMNSMKKTEKLSGLVIWNVILNS